MMTIFLFLVGLALVPSCGKGKKNKGKRQEMEKGGGSGGSGGSGGGRGSQPPPEASRCGGAPSCTGTNDCDPDPCNWDKAGIRDGNSQEDRYYEVSNIIVHGTANRDGNTPRKLARWESNNSTNRVNQDVYSTDQRFNFRARVYEAPSKGTLDSSGERCEMMPMPYGKLSFTVGVRSASNNSTNYDGKYTFRNISVGAITKIYQFDPPITRNNLAIDILDLKWNCNNEGCSGDIVSDGQFFNQPYLWHRDCVTLGIQFSTDYTTDLPGPKINP